MIVESVKEGIKSFDVDRVTCLNTDWSKVGISFAINHREKSASPSITGKKKKTVTYLILKLRLRV